MAIHVLRSVEPSAAAEDRPAPPWIHLCGLATLTFLTRVGTYLVLRSRLTFDTELPWDGWGRIALFMARGYGLADTSSLTYFPVGDVPAPTAARPPVPIFVFAATMRMFGEHLLPIVLVQAAFDAATAILVYAIVGRLFRSGVFDNRSLRDSQQRTTALLAGYAFVCFVPEWRFVIGFQSEPLYTLLFTAALGCVILGNRPAHLAVAGLLFGLGVLSRPGVLIVPFMLAAWLMLGENVRFRYAALVPAVMGIVLVPWAWRNYLVFGEPLVTQTTIGYTLYRHSALLLEDEDDMRWVSVDEGDARIEELLKARGLSPATMSEPELDRLLLHEALQVIRAHKWRFIEMSAHRATWLFYDPNNIGGRTGPVVRLLYLLVVLGLFALIAVAWWYPGTAFRQLTPVWLMFGYTIVIHGLLVAQFRYLLPMIPWLLCVAVYGAVRGYVDLVGGDGERETRRLRLARA